MSCTLIPHDVVRYIGLISPDQAIFSAAQVCKSWNEALDDDAFWLSLITKKGIPLVEGINNGLKTVYRNLSPRTISGEMIAEHFGEVRDIPRMALDRYKMFMEQNDPFIPQSAIKRKICRTFYLVVNPAYVYRCYDEELYKFLNNSENMQDKPELIDGGREMKIPFTLNNRKKLSAYPNQKIYGNFLHKAIVQCNSPADKTTLWLMREEGAYCNLTYWAQKDLVEKKGFQLIPLPVRIAFDAIKIRETGTCPDKSGSNVRTAGRLKRVEEFYSPIVGFFSLSSKVYLNVHSSHDGDHYGVIPGIPAEVRPLVADKRASKANDESPLFQGEILKKPREA